MLLRVRVHCPRHVPVDPTVPVAFVQQLRQFQTRQRMARMSVKYNALFYLRLPPLRRADGVRPGSVNNADTGTTLRGEVVAIVWGRVETARDVKIPFADATTNRVGTSAWRRLPLPHLVRQQQR